jgi:phosphoglycolate phosphatase
MATVVAAWGYLGVGEPVAAWGADAIIGAPRELMPLFAQAGA